MRVRDERFYRLKAAMADLIDRAGGIERAARRASLSRATMGRIHLRDDDAMMSIDCKGALEADAGEPIVTRVEADLLGFRLERITPLPIAPGSPFEVHAAVLTEAADLCRTFANGVADGDYSRADSLAVDRAIADLIRELDRFRRLNAATQAA